ncbi:MAG: YerC/YecD family TrpR-related protein [Candidatus Buchananbacteria bacterium]
MTTQNNQRLSDDLVKILLALKKPGDLKAFFRDLCTLDELKEINERWQIVLLLTKQKTYREIAKKLQVSTTTVARVAYWLNNGQGGYQTALKKLNLHLPHTKPFSQG